jgi:hypothetical protein
MDLVEVGWGDADWICLAQERGGWRALVNLVLNLRGNYRVSKQLLIPPVVFSSIVLVRTDSKTMFGEHLRRRKLD